MSFDPLTAHQKVTESYHDYVKTTFFIKDEELRQQFEDELDSQAFSKGPYIDAVDAFVTGSTLGQLVNEGVLSKEFIQLYKNQRNKLDRPLYAHQETALRRALLDRNLVVTTGTGSGKTESFLFPILNHLMKQKETKGKIPPGVQAILLYPMNALANDQMKRLRSELKEYPDITFGAYTGETEEHDSRAKRAYKPSDEEEEKPLPNEILSRERMKQSPPHLLITNYAMLEYLLIRPEDNVFFHGELADRWKYIVLDEAHVYSGATGMEVSLLLRRLLFTLSNSQNVRFILTSATLGGRDWIKDIIHFANALCAGRNFEPEDIVFARRRAFNHTDAAYVLDPENLIRADKYLESCDWKVDSLEGLNQILQLPAEHLRNLNRNSPLDEFLYNLLEKSDLYISLRRILSSGTKTVSDVAEELNLSEPVVIALIRLVAFARKDGSKLVDVRYHGFIRTLEGAYVTFTPEKTLTTLPRKNVTFQEKEYRVFKINVCQYCGEIYMEGHITGGFLNQDSQGVQEYYMKISDASPDEDGDFDERIYTLCNQCGSMEKSGAREKACECSVSDKIKVLQVKVGKDQDELHKCESCKSTNSRGSILRGFYLGQNAAAGVIGSTLYEQIPETLKIKANSKKFDAFGNPISSISESKIRPLLVFSDSRQEAAFFAPYFEFTHNNIIRRRLIQKSARELAEHYPEGIPLNNLVGRLREYFAFHNVTSLENSLKEAWKSILYELRSGDRNGLVNLGLLSFQYKSEYTHGYQQLTPDEFRSMDKILMESFFREGAVKLPSDITMTTDDIQYFMYHGNQVAFTSEPGAMNPTF